MKKYTESEIADMVKRLADIAADLNGIDPPVPQYPKGITLEFSDDGLVWTAEEFVKYYEGGEYPWISANDAARYARYPVKWDLIGAWCKGIVEFDSGIKHPTTCPDEYAIGYESYGYGTVIWVEKRP